MSDRSDSLNGEAVSCVDASEGTARCPSDIESLPASDKSVHRNACVRAGASASDDTLPAARYPAPTFTLDQAAAEVRRRIHYWVDDVEAYVATAVKGTPPQHLIHVTTGVGKSAITRAAIAERIVRYERDSVAMAKGLIAVPTHALADEVQAALARSGVCAMVWRGREYGAETPRAMCQRLDAVRDAQRARVTVETSVCRYEDNDSIDECPYYTTCRYQAQKADAEDASVVIVTHASLYHGVPSVVRDRAWMVVDEDFTRGRATMKSEITLDALSEPVESGLTPENCEWLTEKRRQIARAFCDAELGYVCLAPFRRAGLTREDCRNAAGYERSLRVDPKMRPSMPPSERQMAAEAAGWTNALANRRARIWQLLGQALADGLEAAGGLVLTMINTGAGRCRAVSPRWRPAIGDGWPKAVLYLDATPSPRIAGLYFEHLATVAECHVDAPHLRISQIQGAPYSKRKLIGSGPADAKTCAKHRARIHAYIQRKAREHGSGQVLVVATKEITQAMKPFCYRPNVELNSYGSLRGIDRYHDYSCLIVLGRPVPSPAVIEEQASALTNRVPVAQPGSQDADGSHKWYDRNRVGARMREGDIVAIRTEEHPDPICEALRRQICDDEVIQAIGRLRGVRRAADRPGEVVIMSDVVVPHLLDEVVAWADEAPDVLDRMLAAANGVAVSCAAHGAKLHPELFGDGSIDAARKSYQRARRRWTNPSRDTPEGNVQVLFEGQLASLIVGRYRVDARGARHQAFAFDPTMMETPLGEIGTLIESALGEDLESTFYDHEHAQKIRDTILDPGE